MAMPNKVKLQITILVIIVILVLGVVYIGFIAPKIARNAVLISMGVSQGGGEGGEEDPIISQLASIKIQVLSDEGFEALRQYSNLPVTPGERGVGNPFIMGSGAAESPS